MRQLQLFTSAALAGMRDRTASRNYSPARDEFRREHERHRAWGLTQRHGARLRRLRDSRCASRKAGLHQHRRQVGTQVAPPSPAPPTSLEQEKCPAHSRPARNPANARTHLEQTSAGGTAVTPSIPRSDRNAHAARPRRYPSQFDAQPFSKYRKAQLFTLLQDQRPTTRTSRKGGPKKREAAPVRGPPKRSKPSIRLRPVRRRSRCRWNSRASASNTSRARTATV
jgi:hypothetical protein